MYVQYYNVRRNVVLIHSVRQKLPYLSEILVPLLPKWHVTRVVEFNPFYLRNFIDERLNYKVLRNVPAAIDYKSFRLDCCEAVNYCPPGQNPDGESVLVILKCR